MNPEHLAKEADRLKSDAVLQRAFDDVKAEALDSLATADADDKTMIVRLQQRVAAIDEIRLTLDRYIMRQPSSEQDEASPYA